MAVELIAIQPGETDKAWIVEKAARICYRSKMSETKEAQAKFLKSLFDKAHTSIAEHARWVWPFSGTPNPFELYWPVRYGTHITPTDRHAADFVISWNARNAMEFDGEGFNPILAGFVDMLRYDDLNRSEKLAHASATFEIGGISRACSHQLVRHRVMSFSQESQRYCDSGDWEPVVPPSSWGDYPCSMGNQNSILSVREMFDSAMNNAKSAYRWLRELGIPKQDARFVLPLATPTRIMITATFEHWRHFLKLRLDKAAQWEIRGVAQQVHAALMEIEPELFEDLS